MSSQSQTEEIVLRPAQQGDMLQLISMIEKIFAEYDMVFDAEEELPDFLAFDAYYKNSDDHLIVAEDAKAGTLAGCTALLFEEFAPRLSRVYVAEAYRGRGIGWKLVDRAMQLAKEHGAEWIHLWTDTRFERAHEFYEQLGYEYTGRVRPLNDINDSYEYHYRKKL